MRINSSCGLLPLLLLLLKGVAAWLLLLPKSMAAWLWLLLLPSCCIWLCTWQGLDPQLRGQDLPVEQVELVEECQPPVALLCQGTQGRTLAA